MTFWKKIAIGCGVLLFGTVGLIGVFIYSLPPFDNMCGNQVLQEYPSPSGKLKAVVFQRDCGTTTGFSTQVSIIQTGSVLENEGGNLFAADTNHDGAPSGIGGGPEIRFRWVTDSSAELQHHSLVRIFHAKTKVEGVQVAFATFADR
jgi:hypothetical protein